MGKKKEKEAKEEDLELSAEELEEELHDEAARIIQSAFRSKLARNLLKNLIRQNYVKLKDRNTNIYYYKNKTTGETSILKPRILKEDDLPSPRDFQAPMNYDPGHADEDGFALLIHVTTFSGEKIPNFTNQIDADRKIFEHLLSHDYICKYRPENVFALKDPTIKVLKDSIERLRRAIKKRSYLFVYICTHVVTISSKVSKDNCFFCFKETVWNNSNQAALTSLSLTEFAALMISLGCERKVIAVNFAHVEPVPKSLFKSRYIYPPEDCLTRLADLCNCCVIGSCNIGTPIQDMKAHTPQPPQITKRRGALKIALSATGSKTAPETSSHSQEHAVLSSSEIIRKKSSIHHHSVQGDDIQHIATDAVRELTSDLMAQYQQEWIEADKKDIVPNLRPKPKLPGLKWKKLSEIPPDPAAPAPTTTQSPPKNNPKSIRTLKSSQSMQLTSRKQNEGNEEKSSPSSTARQAPVVTVEEKELEAGKKLGIQLVLPTTKEILKYRASLALWTIESKVMPAYNFVQSQYRKHRIENGKSPMQRSLLTDRYSLFGQAICNGLNGNILPAHHSQYVSAMDLFLFIRNEMKKNLGHCEEQLDENGNVILARQDPVIFVPLDGQSLSCEQYPICCRCGPPAPPDTPFVVKCKPNSALLEWMMPPFDGVPPTHYKIYMRNNCRLYYDWSVVPGAEFIPYTPDKHMTVRYNVNHLPSGVRVEFCLAAYNNGGWSKLSRASVSVTPGEELEPQSIRAEWKKIVKGGPLAILDRLARYPEYRDEHLRGMHFLVTFAQKEGVGFSRMNIREKVVNLVLHSLRTFPLDNEICSLCFTLVGYSLHGQMHKQLKNKLIKEGFLEEVERCMIKYRNDSSVMNSVNWLRKVFPREVPPNPEQKIIPFGTIKNEEDDELL